MVVTRISDHNIISVPKAVSNQIVATFNCVTAEWALSFVPQQRWFTFLETYPLRYVILVTIVRVDSEKFKSLR